MSMEHSPEGTGPPRRGAPIDAILAQLGNMD